MLERRRGLDADLLAVIFINVGLYFAQVFVVAKSERDMPAVSTAAEMLTYAAGVLGVLTRLVTLKAIHRHEVR